MDSNPLAPVVRDLSRRLDESRAREAALRQQLDAHKDATLTAMADVAAQCRKRLDAEGVM